MKSILYFIYLFISLNLLLSNQMIVVGEVFTESW